jgi:hypothetical protein
MAFDVRLEESFENLRLGGGGGKKETREKAEAYIASDEIFRRIFNGRFFF